ncbi:unnamed protein product [Pseudo-nitzschia multistriata]|uniref:Leucine-rich repeat-containing N-terminal plant-type domain-containing protein n=1 Tax=Pseudo-nitzschia multistriata TaxID=183589 RepID=A0A448YVY3_9STRA|nr:unnamed protein product [Pseudo-nitzschia multistriata]
MLATSDPYPSPHAKPEANVEYGNVQRFPVESDDGYRAQDQRKNRNSYRPLFITLYVMLLLATAGLAFAVTRYVQTVKNKHKSPPSQDTTSDGSTDVDSSSPATLAEVDPDRDLIAYRSDIEYILFTEMDEGLSTDFVEGPQKRAIDWLVSDDLVLNSTEVRAMAEYIKNGDEDSVSTVPLVQRYALMVLFFATNGELWSDSSWRELVNVPECRFMGIECDLEGHINTLDVGYRKLRGRLPGEVGMLSMLTSLNVESNNLEGTIPSFLYNKLTKLERVDMRNNGFLSTISSDISKLTNLKALYLGELFLTGEVPTDAMKSLSSLEEISISHATEMTGPLLEFSEHWPNLTYFDILRSTFTGTIPTTIGTNTNLKYM